MIGLIYEYRKSLKELKTMKQELEKVHEENRSPQDDYDIGMINSMISELTFALRWMETGRHPGAKRGYDKKSVYRDMVYFDPKVLESHIELAQDFTNSSNPESTVNQIDREKIEDALSVLSKREKDIYCMYHVENFSMAEIAKVLDVEKSTIQNHLKRANNKIKKRTEGSLFLVM
ncbi:hypothetical protein DXT76_13640 [Halobacillus trueperi]|uniref:RNA polymerase sigma factor 70 region 4 type 2 domain-containing protein n=1 Tax=Halobacillus trueperi TaxID=156205 RepID=A0A3D8VLL1_9BACI|nr:sigma-70 family RNA polymerase sigma factor [Halobacillus trueperi]RDY70309.1 hypothetical protein DXT76_13640 [Halobacillus trueperi]